jgi:hypothetical protein
MALKVQGDPDAEARRGAPVAEMMGKLAMPHLLAAAFTVKSHDYYQFPSRARWDAVRAPSSMTLKTIVRTRP